jgi:hypothetical protein
MSSKLRLLAALALAALTMLIGAGCSSTPADDTSSSGADARAAHRGKAVKFSECMRDNGVKEFPDPDASGELTMDGVANGSSLDTSSAAFKKAIRSCKELQPPGFTGRKRSTQEQEAALKFAQCIRDHGVEDFPDPVDGEPLVNTNHIPSANERGGMSILNAAMHECGKVYSGELGLKGP